MKVEDVAAPAFAGFGSTNSKADDEKRGTPRNDSAKQLGFKTDESDKDIHKTRKEMRNKNAKLKSMRGKRVKEVHKFPVEPSIVQIIKKPRTYMNHSYRDFSKVPAEIGDEIPESINEKSFPQKVHDILSRDEFNEIISWMPHGRSFRVHVPKMLERRVLEQYFGHTRYSSFLRQLSNYSFKHITRGKDRNCYYHEFMLRGLPHLCKYMPRPKDARSLIPDPENEPNFYSIGKIFPLPDEKQPEEKKEAKPPGVISSASITSPPKNETPGASIVAGQASGQRLSEQMSWLEKQLKPATANLNNSILGLSSSNFPPQQQLTGTNLVAPSNTIRGVQSWPAVNSSSLQATIDRNAAMLASLQGIQAQQQIQASQQLPGLISNDNATAQLAALLQSSLQRRNNQASQQLQVSRQLQAAQQQIQATQVAGLIGNDNTALPSLVPSNNTAQLAALLQSSVQRNNNLFGHF